MATINPWQKFQRLLPKSSYYRATVTNVIGDGLVEVQTQDSQYKVSSNISVTVNALVLVKDDVIVQILPELPYARVEV
ncbi:hypothetical protein [Agarivorans sp. QJM3NY_25]|uniref:hypothetical protein n=1 Tax=Agarivorans sp. QJM3NY_25 TaxID=3421430 RepID=UPI003D7D8D31